MEIIRRDVAREVELIPRKKGVRVIVVQFSDGTFEISIWKKDILSDWEIDYSIFPDVFKAESSRDVYGIIQHIIAPAYEEEYGIDLYF